MNPEEEKWNELARATQKLRELTAELDLAMQKMNNRNRPPLSGYQLFRANQERRRSLPSPPVYHMVQRYVNEQLSKQGITPEEDEKSYPADNASYPRQQQSSPLRRSSFVQPPRASELQPRRSSFVQSPPPSPPRVNNLARLGSGSPPPSPPRRMKKNSF